MSRFRVTLQTFIFLIFTGTAFGATDSKIKIDPGLFVELKECRAIMSAVGSKIWPGWNFSKTPILFYRPHVQDVLIAYPHQPAGFQVLTGFNPLGEEKIYYRDGTTFIDFDGQNTTQDIDGVQTLVVADTFSNQRNQVRGVLLGRDTDFAQKWLEDWLNFLPSDPFAQMAMILHEGFHVYQGEQAPDKGPDEMAAIDYPLLNATNNALWGLEADLLHGALLAPDAATRKMKVKELVAARSERRAALSKDAIEYEDMTEYLEGLAKYVEFQLYTQAEGLQPDPQLFYVNGFHGFGPYFVEARDHAFQQMKDAIAASTDMTGNKFGVGPLRLRLYASGAALALILDDVSPSWKAGVFKPQASLFDTLKNAVPLSADERASLVTQAKNEYGYEALFKEKAHFEGEGRRVLNERVKSILETPQTLVVLDYSGAGGIAGMAFTPFGVAKVGENMTLYDMVPLAGRFGNKAEFRFAQVIPVLVDKARQVMEFDVKTPASAFSAQKGNEIKVEEFTLTGCALDVTTAENKVKVKMLKQAP